ncbi:MAG: hypothetical protein EA403_00040 [Spirochaetaceae bacterium]|nr:MAG: hypothetical protein EA403_00040 [Spirochaetaceae bacterium]
MNRRTAQPTSRRRGPSGSELRTLLLVVGIALMPAAAQALDWEVGTRFGFETQPAAFDDPYAFSLGLGIFADVAPLALLPVRFGITLSRYFFDSRSPAFSDSTMPTPGVYLAYPAYRVADDSIDWRIEPYLEYRLYRRTHRFLDAETTSQRPLTALGVGLISLRRFGVSSGVAIEYQTVWDNTPVHRAALLLRLGIRSRAPGGAWS